jgi:hypothetical protein
LTFVPKKEIPSLLLMQLLTNKEGKFMRNQSKTNRPENQAFFILLENINYLLTLKWYLGKKKIHPSYIRYIQNKVNFFKKRIITQGNHTNYTVITRITQGNYTR